MNIATIRAIYNPNNSTISPYYIYTIKNVPGNIILVKDDYFGTFYLDKNLLNMYDIIETRPGIYGKLNIMKQN